MSKDQTNRIPLHLQIASALRKQIARSMKTGDRLDSEAALGKRFNTSSLTVREALSTLAHDGMIERRHGSGTFVLDPLARQHVAVHIELDISHPRTSYSHLRTLQQVRRLVTASGVKTRLYVGDTAPGEVEPAQLSCTELLEDITEGRICGIVSVATPSTPSGWVSRAVSEGVPVVGNSSDFPMSVSTSIEDLISAGVRHLAELGRRNIALIGWGGSEPNDAPKPFRDAMRRAGLSVEPRWVRTDLHPSTLGAGWEEFREVWSALPQKPDGLVISDDMLLTDVASAVQSLRIRVPQDLSIITHMTRGAMLSPPFPVDRLVTDPDAVARDMAELIVAAVRQQPIKTFRRSHGFTLESAAAERPVIGKN
jgi:DNA-binding LacI/PurR family transcriptional regulator